MGEMAKQGITKNQHAVIHTWLRRKFGSANKCENPLCTGKSKYFHWSLIKGKLYERNRDNFQMLCASCHVSYDWNEYDRQYMRNLPQEVYDRAAASKRGRKVSPERLKQMSERMKGAGNPMYGVRMTGEKSHMFGKNLSEDSRRKIFKARAKLTKEQYDQIMNLDAEGVKQKDIAAQFNLSKASICRIVNKKRYKLW